jgi:hypothetical protein
MKKEIVVFGLFILVLNACTDKKKAGASGGDEQTGAVAVSKHSELFNKSVENFMNAYYAMIEGFVNWDTAVVKKESASFKTALDSFKIDELKKDTLTYVEAERVWNAVKAETDAIVGDNNLDEQRGSLNVLSQSLFDLLNKVHYDHSKIYYQECPMAFNDENPGNWLSAASDIRNPYLGTLHPKYKSGMLKCGSTKDSVNSK